MNEKSMNEIVANNIKSYIEARGKSHKWVIERTKMSKGTFYNLLKGEGDIFKHVEAISRLFKIEDPDFFFKVDFQIPLGIQEIRANQHIHNLAAASYYSSADTSEFHNTMNILDDFITMIDALEIVSRMEQV